MRTIFGILCLALALVTGVRVVSLIISGGPSKQGSRPPPGVNASAYETGRKVGVYTAYCIPVVFGALGLWLVFGGGSGGSRPVPLRRQQPMRGPAPPRPIPATTTVPSGPLKLPIKIECGCGQHYSFEAVPVNGRMPGPVSCPSCGADGTAVANQIIQQLLAVEATSMAGSATGPMVSRDSGSGSKTPLVILGVVSGLVVGIILAGVLFLTVTRRSRPPQPIPPMTGPSSPIAPTRPTGAMPPRQASPSDWPGRPGDGTGGPFTVGDKVEVFWSGGWQPGTVLALRGPTVQVRFDDASRVPQVWMITNHVRMRK